MSDLDFLILSGAYIGPDLIAEFGELPPAFLPHGVRRLYERQIEFAKHHTDSVYLTIPASFEVPPSDRRRLDELGVKLIPADPDCSLAEAIQSFASAVDLRGSLAILFGDTLVELPGPPEPDTFAVAPTNHLAAWTGYSMSADGLSFGRKGIDARDEGDVVAGYFFIAHCRDFCDALSSSSDFFRALEIYSNIHSVQPFRPAAWRDFGHLHSYYQSRKSESSTRSFNSIRYNDDSITKSGLPPRKLYAESRWYQDIPLRFRAFTPNFVGASELGDRFEYEIEYLYLTSVSELFSFSSLPRDSWIDILGSCAKFLTECQTHKPCPHEAPFNYSERFFRDVVSSKTIDRICEFAKKEGIDVDAPWTINDKERPSMCSLYESLLRNIRHTDDDDICLWHGDFHFGNMFFDFRSRRIKVIDPRGMLPDGTLSIFGDARYDIAKLCHSVVGMYDLIISSQYTLHERDRYHIDFKLDASPGMLAIADAFSGMSFGRYKGGQPDIMALTAILFLGMLPLHGDSRRRQYAMLANAYRISDLAGGEP
jgi:hypothetical protein